MEYQIRLKPLTTISRNDDWGLKEAGVPDVVINLIYVDVNCLELTSITQTWADPHKFQQAVFNILEDDGNNSKIVLDIKNRRGEQWKDVTHINLPMQTGVVGSGSFESKDKNASNTALLLTWESKKYMLEYRSHQRTNRNSLIAWMPDG